MDEFTEALTLIQTNRIPCFPVVLFGSDYWSGFLSWLRKSVYTAKCISPEDMKIFRVTDDPKEVVRIVKNFRIKRNVCHL